jgi:hypothetical protein
MKGEGEGEEWDKRGLVVVMVPVSKVVLNLRDAPKSKRDEAVLETLSPAVLEIRVW